MGVYQYDMYTHTLIIFDSHVGIFPHDIGRISTRKNQSIMTVLQPRYPFMQDFFHPVSEVDGFEDEGEWEVRAVSRVLMQHLQVRSEDIGLETLQYQPRQSGFPP